MTGFPTENDDARSIADAHFDLEFFRTVDEQILAIGGELVEQRARPFSCAYPVADPSGSALSAGKGVAVKAALGASSEPLMVLATAANLAAGAVLLGVLTEATPAGQRGRVAVGGVIPPSVSGLSSAGIVRVNASTAALEIATTPAPGDAIVGRSTSGGAVSISVGATTSEPSGYASVAFSSDANKTATAAEQASRYLAFTSSVTLTAGRSYTVDPTLATSPWWIVRNRTSARRPIVFKGTSGTGATILYGVPTLVHWDGVDMRVVGNPVTEESTTAQTTDGTVTDTAIVTLPDNCVVRIRALVSGRAAASGDSAAYERVATVKRFGGGATLVGAVASVTTQEDVAGWDATIAVTGNTAVVQVTGAAATTVDWNVRALVEVGTFG